MNLSELVQIHQAKMTQTDWLIFKGIKDLSLRGVSIQELANRNHVSTTTVFRFCQKIGLSGFSELKVLQKNAVEERQNSRQQFPLLYHEVVKYIEKINIDGLKKSLNSSECIYIYACSELELRLAREMQRIFFPIKKSIFILPNQLALNYAIPSIVNQIIFFLMIDSSDLPLEIQQKQQYYSLLLSPIQYLPVVVDKQILVPTLSSKQKERSNVYNITPYILALELIYLKLQLE